MALSSYAELKAALAEWLGRGGDATLAALAGDFVRLAEARLGRDLRLRAMELRLPGFAIAGAWTPLPADLLELRAIALETSPRAPLALMPPDEIERRYAGAAAGRPRAYAVVGGELRVAPAPGSPCTAELVYWRRLPPLSDAAPSNWLLEHAPDLYLYAALLEAEAFIGDDERLPLWLAAYDRAAAALQAAEDRGRWPGAAPQARPEAAP